MDVIEELTNKIRSFTEERDWEQFHNPKDLAIALSIEAGELLECFLWKNPEDANMEKIREELADVIIYSLRLADKENLCIKDIVYEKIKQNEAKYPIEKAKGSCKKYDQL